ncbi:hypothetical protein EHS39_36055 [Ensifer sp. MPMI2T]|nr:hypothetical protein EHS39_36055 [Ensifer sp. MPMI2T]
MRWQVEIAFKRLKSGLGIHKLPARDERLARSWLMAHVIVALLIDEAVTDVLDSPPAKTTSQTLRSLSLWRLHSLLKHAILSVILTARTTKKISKRFATVMRHICDPPRRRASQANAARRHHQSLS